MKQYQQQGSVPHSQIQHPPQQQLRQVQNKNSYQQCHGLDRQTKPSGQRDQNHFPNNRQQAQNNTLETHGTGDHIKIGIIEVIEDVHLDQIIKIIKTKVESNMGKSTQQHS